MSSNAAWLLDSFLMLLGFAASLVLVWAASGMAEGSVEQRWMLLAAAVLAAIAFEVVGRIL